MLSEKNIRENLTSEVPYPRIWMDLLCVAGHLSGAVNSHAKEMKTKAGEKRRRESIYLESRSSEEKDEKRERCSHANSNLIVGDRGVLVQCI